MNHYFALIISNTVARNISLNIERFTFIFIRLDTEGIDLLSALLLV